MPTNLTPEQLAEWERVCERATPGEWHNRYDRKTVQDAYDSFIAKTHDRGIMSDNQCFSDGDFIATARTAMPALIKEVKRLRALLSSCENCLRDATDHIKETGSKK